LGRFVTDFKAYGSKTLKSCLGGYGGKLLEKLYLEVSKEATASSTADDHLKLYYKAIDGMVKMKADLGKYSIPVPVKTKPAAQPAPDLGLEALVKRMDALALQLSQERGGSGRRNTCWNCGDSGHVHGECTKARNEELFQAGLKTYRARMEEKEKKGEIVLGAMALQEMASSLGAAATSIPSKRIRVDDFIHRDPPPRPVKGALHVLSHHHQTTLGNQPFLYLIEWVLVVGQLRQHRSGRNHFLPGPNGTHLHLRHCRLVH
jgi:hypothetical protein